LEAVLNRLPANGELIGDGQRLPIQRTSCTGAPTRAGVRAPILYTSTGTSAGAPPRRSDPDSDTHEIEVAPDLKVTV
jgi:hypothetical protein